MKLSDEVKKKIRDNINAGLIEYQTCEPYDVDDYGPPAVREDDFPKVISIISESIINTIEEVN